MDMSERKVIAFFDLGTQYYVVARYATFSALAPVCGNLFHHAIEMYLKGYLSSRLELKQLKELGHRLQDTWSQFKSVVGDPGLDGFDSTISELDKFETIRYPDRVLVEGMRVSVNIERLHPQQSGSEPVRPEPVFQLIVEDIDRLIAVIFEKATVNPRFYWNQLNTHATSYLNRVNKAL